MRPVEVLESCSHASLGLLNRFRFRKTALYFSLYLFHDELWSKRLRNESLAGATNPETTRPRESDQCYVLLKIQKAQIALIRLDEIWKEFAFCAGKTMAGACGGRTHR